jgi:hypothetical protein
LKADIDILNKYYLEQGIPLIRVDKTGKWYVGATNHKVLDLLNKVRKFLQ